MKNEYGKLKNGVDHIYCTVQNFRKYMDLVFGDECPDGFLPIEKVLPKPEPKDGEVLWFNYYIDGDVLKKKYFCRKPPRIFSKLNIYLVLQPLGLYDLLMEFLKSIQTPDGINGMDAYTIANELSEEHPLFFEMMAGALEYMQLSPEEADEILEKCKV